MNSSIGLIKPLVCFDCCISNRLYNKRFPLENKCMCIYLFKKFETIAHYSQSKFTIMKYKLLKKTHLLFALAIVLFLTSCQKDVSDADKQKEVEQLTGNNQSNGHLNQTKTFSSEVAQKWQDMQLRILRRTGTNIYGMNGNRYFAYTGIGLYEQWYPVCLLFSHSMGS